MRITLIAFFFVALNATLGRAQCPIVPTTVFYLNGIDKLAGPADDARGVLDAHLRQAISSKYGNIEISTKCLNSKLAYNPTGGIIADLLESAEQICASNIDPKAGALEWTLNHWLGFTDSNATLCQADPTADALRKYFNITNLSEDTIQLMMVYAALYHKTIQTDNRDVIVVAHSQGNLFANLEYKDSRLSESDRSRLHLVAVATPSDHVEGYSSGEEKYVTIRQDKVASLLFPSGHLQPNSDNYNCANQFYLLQTTFCHAFVESYLANEDSQTKTLQYIMALIRPAGSNEPINQPPSAGFLMSAGGTSATGGQTLKISVPAGMPATVTFNAGSSSDPDGVVAGYEWSIDGAVVSMADTFNSVFSQGTHVISLIVTDDAGARSPAVQGTIVVTETGPISNQAPIAGFLMSGDGKSAISAQTLSLSVPVNGSTTVTFDGQPPRSSDLDGIVTGYEWSINGTVTSDLGAFSVVLGKGSYPVSLVVTDNLGAKSIPAQGLVVITEQSPVTAYTITDIGTFPEGIGSVDDSFGLSVNASGQVAGWGGFSLSGGINGTYHAFLYTPGTPSKLVDIGTFPPFDILRGSSGAGINASGQVTGGSSVGTIYTSSWSTHAFLYSDGVLQDLGTLPGGNYSEGKGINDLGQVTGEAETSTGCSDTTWSDLLCFHAFVYTPANGMTDIGAPAGFKSAYGVAINNAGQVTGYADTALNIEHAFIYTPGEGMTDIGVPAGFSSSKGLSINAAGQVTGEAATSSGEVHAFLYSNGQMIVLGSLPGGQSSWGRGINSLGEIVGFADSTSGETAFLYRPGIGMIDLNTLLPNGSGWILDIANGISDTGQITGSGRNSNGESHAFLLSPVH